MVKQIIRTIINSIRQEVTMYSFMLKVFKKGGFCGKGLHLSYPEFVKFEKLSIKSGFRIDCYPEFAGVKK